MIAANEADEAKKSMEGLDLVESDDEAMMRILKVRGNLH
jgi:hypothetical protein